MTEIIKIALPIYFTVYFGLAFVLKSVMVARKIGKNPLVLPRDDSAYGLIGRYFKTVLIAMFFYVTVQAFFDISSQSFLPIKQLETPYIQYLGSFLLIIALIWTIFAQNDLKDSWRIGIDTVTKTNLITSGLFGISRNPIFFGMIFSLFGLFLTQPNAFTALFLIIGYVLIQIQIRLEEEFLLKQHGQAYQEYKQTVRRLI
jgi:protein-S-isoprenylcysteine O-methyltransferase Ste14